VTASTVAPPGPNPVDVLIQRAPARRTPPERAGELLDLCVEGDAACKSGRGEPDRVLERIALRIGSV